MPNANEHRIKAGTAVGLAVAVLNEEDDQSSVSNALVAGGIAYTGGTLPDIIEPPQTPTTGGSFTSGL